MRNSEIAESGFLFVDGMKDIDEEQEVEGESGVDREADVVGAEGVVD